MKRFSNYKILSCDLDWKNSKSKEALVSQLKKNLNSNVLSGKNLEQTFTKVIVSRSTAFLSTIGPTPSYPEVDLLEENRSIFEILTGYDDIISEYKIGRDYILVNGSYYRFVNILEFPSEIHFGELTSLRYDDGLTGIFPFFLFKGYRKSESEEILEKMARPHHGNTTKGIEALGTVRENRKTSMTLEEITSLNDAVMRGDELLFETSFWYIAKSSSLEGLDQISRSIVNFIREKSGVPYFETVANKELFKMIALDEYYNFNRTHLVYTSFLSMMIPYISEAIHSKGIEFRSESNEELFINIRDPESENYNCIFSGVSGGGKSFLVNKVVFEGLLHDEHTLVIDKGESFLRTTMFFDGNVFSAKFNPMQFRSPRYLSEFLFSFIPHNEMTTKDKGQVFTIVKEYLLDEKNTSFNKLVELIDSHFKGFRYYFEQLKEYLTEEHIEIHKITYVDRNNYPTFLFKGLFIYLIEYFRNIKGRKNLIVDEVWETLRDHSDFLDSSIREFRKEDGSVFTVIQRLKDFIDKDDPKNVGNVIFDLSSHKFIFNQDIDGVNGFSDDEVRAVSELHTVKGKFSKFLYKSLKISKLVIYSCTPLEHELFTTEKKDTIPMRKYLEKYADYKSFSSSMRGWVDFKYNHGQGRA